jgi:hypothetical protein
METCYPVRLATAAPATATSFTAKTLTATEPTGSGVVDLFDANLGLATSHKVPKRLLLVPYGGNSDNETFDFQVWGWSQIHDLGETWHDVWVPQLLLQGNVILTSLSGTSLGANLLMADSIVVAKGAADTSINAPIVTSNDLGPASVTMDLFGVRKIEFEFDLTGTGDQAGLLWRVIDEC